jgi:Flagellar P-ring protein
MKRYTLLFGALWLIAAGCAHNKTRLQAEDETAPDKVAAVETIGKVSTVDNANPIVVSGVGLVANLDGAGAEPPPGGYRSLLEDQLRKLNKVDNVKEVLASPTTSLVLVSGVIPAGAHKDDPIDVEVTVPRECRTTSLRGGRLIKCVLYNYDTKRHLDPNYKGPDQLLPGHPVARAEGLLSVAFDGGDEATKLRKAHIWGGGRCALDRPFYIVLNSNQQYARVAQAVAERVNETFHGSVQGPGTALASAKTKSVVVLSVPSQYRLNMPRYLRVVRLIPLWQTAAERIPYRRWLEEQLLDPAHAVTAALRLEALGSDSVDSLKHGLNSEHPLVRFCSAEALAYLGSPSCGEELARAVEEQPALRAFGLTALASLDEAVCHVQLRRLLSSPSAETRYGAFRALRALDEHEDAVQGEEMNGSFWLHRVAPGSPGLVHISTWNRAEIVLFGDEARLQAPFARVIGEFTVTAREGDEGCTISRTSLRHGKNKRQCSLKLDDVIHTLSDMGATYTDVVELLRHADRLQYLSCRVAVDALPERVDVEDLAKTGAGDSKSAKTNSEIIEAKAELGATPTLFEHTNARRSRFLDDADESATDTTRGSRGSSKSATDRDSMGGGLD